MRDLLLGVGRKIADGLNGAVKQICHGENYRRFGEAKEAGAARPRVPEARRPG
jgi:hypothetical protein